MRGIVQAVVLDTGTLCQGFGVCAVLLDLSAQRVRHRHGPKYLHLFITEVLLSRPGHGIYKGKRNDPLRCRASDPVVFA